MGAGGTLPPADPARTHRVVVEICGEQYALRGDHEPAYMQDLAARLDARMRELAKRRPRLGATQVAVLTALNALDELAQLEAQYNRVLALFEREWERRRAAATGGRPAEPPGAGGGVADGRVGVPAGDRAAPGAARAVAPVPEGRARRGRPGPEGGGAAVPRPGAAVEGGAPPEAATAREAEPPAPPGGTGGGA